MRNFKADYVFPVSSSPIKNGVVSVDDFGEIISVRDYATYLETESAPVEHLHGVICPGFINTHCHLELSHMKGKIGRHTGLVDFIKNIQKQRHADPAEITDAALKADETMRQNGIVAVGDISNTNVTLPIKAESKLYYHTFVECFSFMPEKAQAVFDSALALMNEFKPLSSSITPHAPYSVSKDLFKLIKQYCDENENLLSMHNQECEDENKFYRYKQGEFVGLYNDFGIDISYFKPQARNSLQSVVHFLSAEPRILLVHNTVTNLKDIYFVKRFGRKISWCFCPKANLYIEDMLPKVELFVDQGFNITLGTDSLASNDKLCILDEMRTLQQHFHSLTTETLIEWATLNGAKFLGIDDEKGSIEPGKTPGLNLITGLDKLRITPETKVKPLI